MYSFVAYRASITLWWQSTHLQVFEVLSWGWYTRLGMWEGILILENFSRTLWSKIYLVKKLVPRGYIDMTKTVVFSNRSHHAPILSICAWGLLSIYVVVPGKCLGYSCFPSAWNHGYHQWQHHIFQEPPISNHCKQGHGPGLATLAFVGLLDQG
jgi:hypothetical protein